jgi:UDPglucose 6-dehydrogenase
MNLSKSESEINQVGIIGLGFVGSAIEKSFNILSINTIGYDKFKNDGIGSFDKVCQAQIIFLCLPTPYDSLTHSYDKSAIYETCDSLHQVGYKGLVVIKSTIEIGTTNFLEKSWPLSYVHNPEFLTARTAFEDFHSQNHIVLGRGSSVSDDLYNMLVEFYSQYYPNAKISQCVAGESEAMKLFCNCFYSVKIQFFNELYLLSEKLGIDYSQVKNLMLENGWINPMHTTVPGPDGLLSYGGLCFPKDTNALNELMKKLESPNAVINAVINERETMRSDHDNCK